MVHASLFSGIGGFDLAASWAGWRNAFHCEINAFARKVLAYYFPQSISYENIIETDFLPWRNAIDVLSGGFPCQPFSMQGERQGADDPRHLWPEMLRAVREVRPPFVVGENVPGLISWGEGMVFEQAHLDMEAEGYEPLPLVLPACGVGALHERERVWLVFFSRAAWQERAAAHAHGLQLQAYCPGPGRERSLSQPPPFDYLAPHHAAQWSTGARRSGRVESADGLSARLDGIAFPKWHAESIKALGNAIVPELAYRIFCSINESVKCL